MLVEVLHLHMIEQLLGRQHGVGVVEHQLPGAGFSDLMYPLQQREGKNCLERSSAPVVN